MKHVSGSTGLCHVLRLQPGDDVRRSLQEWAQANAVDAASITCVVGSLTHAHLRYANRADGIVTTADLEVLSLSGTISRHGMHLHMSVGDRNGNVLGGHLLDGCVVRTTLELTVQEINGLRMLRSRDEQTGYEELDTERK